jgi:hypothetical protein
VANWPSIANPDFGFRETVYKPQIRQESEANYVQSRPRSTRAVKRWELTWSLLSEADYQTLLAFFTAYQGSSFVWIHPVSAVSYTCRFSADTLESEIMTAGWRKVSCPIEEL